MRRWAAAWLGVLCALLLAVPAAWATPAVTITSPQNGATVTNPSLAIQGSASSITGTASGSVSVNGGAAKALTVTSGGGGSASFSGTVTLAAGANSVVVSITDTNAQTGTSTGTATASVTLQTVPVVTLKTPSVSGTTITFSGSVSDASVTQATVIYNGAALKLIPVSAGSFSSFVSGACGLPTLAVSATNAAGTGTSSSLTVAGLAACGSNSGNNNGSGNGGSGNSSSGNSGSAATTTSTSAGALTVSNGAASLAVGSTAVQNLVHAAQSGNATQVVLDASAPASTTGSGTAPIGTTQVAVPADALTALVSASKPVEVHTSDGDLTLSPAVVKQLSQAATAQGGTAQIGLSSASESSVAQALGQATPANPEVNAGLQAAGGSVTFTLSVRSSIGASTDVGAVLAAPVTIHVPFNQSAVTALTAPLAGIYRLDPQSGAWEYVGPCGARAAAAACAGHVDPASGAAEVERQSLSTYAVMTFSQVFSDMVGHWAANDVQVAAAHHVVEGIAPGTFGPDLTVTRAQFAAMVQRLLMLPVPAAPTTFSDVSAHDWFAGAVAAVVKAGIVTGFPDGTFRPNDPITREQMAAMITRTMAAGGASASVTEAQAAQLLDGFADNAQVSNWARNAIAVAVSNGILKGKPAGLAPQGDATRAEAAAMLERLLSYFGAY